MAISEDELAQLGLDGCENEAPEYAKLFWGDEELEDVGGGRYYPKRQALRCLVKRSSHMLENISMPSSVQSLFRRA